MSNEPNERKDFKEFLKTPAGRAGLILFLYAIIFGLFMLFIAVINTVIAFIFAALFGYFGWQFLNRLQPDIFLIMPIGGWIIYFFIKGFLAVIIGMFVSPLAIARMVADEMQKK